MKKRFLSLIMALTIVTALFPITATAAELQYGDLYYVIEGDNTITITDCNVSAVNVDIPAQIDGMSVTRILTRAFLDCKGLTSITIPNSITRIDDYTFQDCTGLTSIKVDKDNPNYSSLDGNLFNKDKTELKRYAIGKTDTHYTIPDSVTSIGSEAFQNCTEITSVTIPDSVTVIGSMAFTYCSNLTNITIPSSVTNIGYYAFACCTNLTNIAIPGSVTDIGIYAFSGCTGLTNVTLPNSVTSIGSGVFSNCTDLTSITIPSSVTSINNGAFYHSTGLTSINVDSNNPNYSSLDGNLFNKDKTKLILYAMGKTDMHYTIPDIVTNIGKMAFRDCSSLTSVTIPSSVTIIDENAFDGCTGLTKLTIPDSVINIGEVAFLNCNSLTSITISTSVTRIGMSAFLGCENLKDVYYTGTETEWNQISIGEYNDSLLYTNIHFADDNADVKIKDVIEEKSERKVSANFQNNSEENQTFEAICAVYDARGALITYENVTITVTSGETRDVTFFLSTSNWASYKLFAWDELGNMQPLSWI